MENLKVTSELEEIYIAAVSGKADSGTTTTLVDSDLTVYDDDTFNNMVLSIIAGTNKGQSRRITDFVKSTGTITVGTAFTKAIDNTSEYIVKHFVVAAAGGDATLAKQNEILEDLTDIEGTGFVKDTQSLVNIKTDTADIQSRVPRVTCHMDFWSDNVNEIVLTTTVGADHNLPNCVVAGLPTGITIIRVVALLKIALIKDTSAADNAINGATSLKVDSSSLYDSLVTAIDIPDNSWAVDVSEATERGGDVMIGDNDVKAEVTGNATYYGQLTDIVCDGNNLKLKDIAWGLRIYFTV